MEADLFPDLAAERNQLASARCARGRMNARLEAVDPDGAADEVTTDYIEVTVAEALEDLRGPGAGDCSGRIDDEADRWYIGRRHIEDESHDPLVVDWRAPIAAPFYRATGVDSLGLEFRRRFTLDDGELVAYLDEDLDDPEVGGSAAGIPDPVLAEIGAERSGEMREIVATIQGEQDVVIRSDLDQVVIVQGGPGTGKTAVALHRAAYLLFEHRVRLGRDGVLVVGPNRAFLDYIGNVLPSLGERTVRQATEEELCLPRVEVMGTDDAETARWKGSPERLADLADRVVSAIRPPSDDVVVPIGVRNHVIGADEFAEWVSTAIGGTTPDEVQDHSAVAPRVIGRRSPTASMTFVGDVAQSTTPAGQERWEDVFAPLGPAGSSGRIADLTIGYRVPEPILSVANRLLPLTVG